MTRTPTKPRREYLVALTARSVHHAWIEAHSEDEAEELALELWDNDDGIFVHKDGGIDDVTVLESRELRAQASKPRQGGP